jgi:hypothetical protein
MRWHLRKTGNRFYFPAPHRQTKFSAVICLAAALFILFGNGCKMLTKTENKDTRPANKADSQPESANAALTIHRRAIAIDLHADSVQRAVDEGLDLGQRLPDGHFDTARAKDGGLDAQFFSIWVEPELFGGGGKGAIERADKQIAAVRSLVDRYPQTWELATTAAGIRRAATEGKLARLERKEKAG